MPSWGMPFFDSCCSYGIAFPSIFKLTLYNLCLQFLSMKLEAVNAHANQGVEAFPVKDVSQLLKCVVKSKIYLSLFIICVLLCSAPQTLGWCFVRAIDFFFFEKSNISVWNHALWVLSINLQRRMQHRSILMNLCFFFHMISISIRILH